MHENRNELERAQEHYSTLATKRQRLVRTLRFTGHLSTFGAGVSLTAGGFQENWRLGVAGAVAGIGVAYACDRRLPASILDAAACQTVAEGYKNQISALATEVTFIHLGDSGIPNQ